MSRVLEGNLQRPYGEQPFAPLGRGTAPLAMASAAQGRKRRVLPGLRLCVATILATMLIGCVSYRAKPLDAAQVATDFSRRTLTAPELRSFLENALQQPNDDWPPPSWDLARLTLAAFYYHPDLDVARARLAVAEAALITAGERPNPTLNLTPGYDTTNAIPSPWIPLTWLDIPVETAGKRGYRIRQASQLSEAARLNILSVAWQVHSRVRSALIQVWASRQADSLLTEQVSLQTENLLLLEKQHRAGAISAFELELARVAANSTRLALDEAQRQRAEAAVQLADAVGVPAAALATIDLSFGQADALPQRTIEDSRRQALLGRADLLSLLAEYAASQSALQLEIAKQFPDVRLGPGYQYDQGDNKWSLGVTVTLPLLNQNQGAIAEAEARRDQAAASFNALQARVLAEIDRAFAAYQMAARKTADADAILDSLKRQDDIGRGMLDAGEISRADLAALRLQLSASRLASLDARVRSQQALGNLEDALQRPLGTDEGLWQNSPRPSQPAAGDESS